MDCLMSSLAVLAQGLCGLVYLCILAVICFGVADSLGFVKPLPGEEPNERWLARQAKKEGRKTDAEMLAEYLARPTFKVVDEFGEAWLTMPRDTFDNVLGQFGICLAEEEETDATGGEQ